MTVLGKSTLTFFTLFVAGSIVAALFGAFASSDARTRRD